MKRILHLIDTTGPGGAETVFLNLLRGLGPDWESLPVVKGPGWVEDSVREAGFRPLMIPSSGRFDLPYLRRLGKAIRDNRIDLIQTHLFSTTLYGGLAGRLQRVPVIGTFHGDPDLGAAGLGGRIRFGLIRANTAKVVCVSESLRDRTMERAGFRLDELEVIQNGIDTALFRPGGAPGFREGLGIAPETFLVGSVGNVRHAKDYETLLRAARLVRDQTGNRIHFLVAGQPTLPLFDRIEGLQQELELQETVSFLGFRDDIPDLLRALDLFLLTSANEGFSLVTVQAMATGLPVVATRSGGPEGILEHGKEGLLCDTEDPAALAESILRVRDDPGLAGRMGKAGLVTARARYSLDSMVERYEELYRMTLSG